MSDMAQALRGNPVYQACVEELEKFRIPHAVEKGGRHFLIVFSFRGQTKKKPISATINDNRRATKRAQADIRRMIREADRAPKNVSGRGEPPSRNRRTETMHDSAKLLPLNFEGREIRITDREGNPWFSAVDVCRALELKGDPGQHVRRLDDDEKGLIAAQTAGGRQEVLFVSEAGAYRLVFSSRKAEAERFKRWLAHEVLPQIRRVGSFMPTTLETLSSDVRSEIGGIVKSVVGKALEPLIAGQELMVDGLAEISIPGAQATLTDPGMVTAFTVIGMAELDRGRRYKGLCAWVSKDLQKYCARYGYRTRLVDMMPGERWEFQREAAEEWLADGGRTEIWQRVKDHEDRKKGQSVIDFPSEKSTV